MADTIAIFPLLGRRRLRRSERGVWGFLPRVFGVVAKWLRQWIANPPSRVRIPATPLCLHGCGILLGILIGTFRYGRGGADLGRNATM